MYGAVGLRGVWFMKCSGSVRLITVLVIPSSVIPSSLTCSTSVLSLCQITGVK